MDFCMTSVLSLQLYMRWICCEWHPVRASGEGSAGLVPRQQQQSYGRQRLFHSGRRWPRILEVRVPHEGHTRQRADLTAKIEEEVECFKCQMFCSVSRWFALVAVCGSVVGWGTMLQCRRFEASWGVWIFLNLPNPSGRTRPWGLLSL
jgi:hypothetical protein